MPPWQWAGRVQGAVCSCEGIVLKLLPGSKLGLCRGRVFVAVTGLASKHALTGSKRGAGGIFCGSELAREYQPRRNPLRGICAKGRTRACGSEFIPTRRRDRARPARSGAGSGRGGLVGMVRAREAEMRARRARSRRVQLPLDWPLCSCLPEIV